MRKISANDDLMTTREVGETLGVAVRTVQLWVESGVLPAWRTAGGHRRIARSAVEKLMRERSEATQDVTIEIPPPLLKILVVEDDANLLNLYSQVVASWNFPVDLTTATNGFEGLLRIGQVVPDLVVADLNMPGMDGFQMLRSLKRNGAGFDRLKVVVISALTPEEIQERGGLPKGVTFFAKPVHYGELQALVRSMLPGAVAIL